MDRWVFSLSNAAILPLFVYYIHIVEVMCYVAIIVLCCAEKHQRRRTLSVTWDYFTCAWTRKYDYFSHQSGSTWFQHLEQLTSKRHFNHMFLFALQVLVCNIHLMPWWCASICFAAVASNPHVQLWLFALHPSLVRVRYVALALDFFLYYLARFRICYHQPWYLPAFDTSSSYTAAAMYLRSTTGLVVAAMVAIRGTQIDHGVPVMVTPAFVAFLLLAPMTFWFTIVVMMVMDTSGEYWNELRLQFLLAADSYDDMVMRSHAMNYSVSYCYHDESMATVLYVNSRLVRPKFIDWTWLQIGDNRCGFFWKLVRTVSPRLEQSLIYTMIFNVLVSTCLFLFGSCGLPGVFLFIFICIWTARMLYNYRLAKQLMPPECITYLNHAGWSEDSLRKLFHEHYLVFKSASAASTLLARLDRPLPSDLADIVTSFLK